MIAERALRGVGDSTLGEWREAGRGNVMHIRRRLSAAEVATYGCVVRDIRGTPEEEKRLAVVFSERPDLRLYL